MQTLPSFLFDRRSVLGRAGWHWQLGLISLGIATLSALAPVKVEAATPDTAPPALKTFLTQVDAAANRQNVQEVLRFYSPAFKHSDGLTRETLEQSLTQLWKRYPNLQYRTELKSWKADGTAIVAETVTRITGRQTLGNREFTLDTTLTARQRLENQAIVSQEILDERSQMTSGSKPPSVKLMLPAQVATGQDYSVDAIVEEPLGDDLLLGTALEEPVRPEGLLNPTIVNLELLSAGGIFKVGRAPAQPDNRWISAVVVRHNGLTMVTRRLQVVDRKP
jgi:hypothetical protein